MRSAAGHIATIFVAGTVLLAAASCSSSSGGSSAPTGANGLEKGASLKIWLNNGGTVPAAKALINKWAASSGVKVSMQTIASTDYQQDLLLAFKTGKGPDVYAGGDPRTFVKAGVMLPLNDLLPADVTTAYKAALEPPQNYIVDGKIYSIPLTVNTTRMVYNKDLFNRAGLDPAKPPNTIGEVEADCAKIAAAGAYCFGVPMKYNGFVPKNVEPLVASTSVDYAQGGLFDLKTQKFAFDALTPAIELYRKTVSKKWAYPGASSLDNDQMRSAFAQGKIAMYVGMSYDYPELVAKYKTKINWGVGPVPAPDGMTAVRSVAGQSGGYSVYSKTKYPHAAVALLAYLAGKKAVQDTLEAGSFPVRQDITPSDTSPQYKGFSVDNQDAITLPSPAKVVDVTGNTFRDVVDQLILGKGDVASALRSLNSTYDKAYQKAIDQGTVQRSDYSL